MKMISFDTEIFIIETYKHRINLGMARILNVSSSIGNIGDDASFIGLTRILHECFDEVSLSRINIRRAYKNAETDNRLIFDEEFVSYMNSFDYCIFGGGAFLDYPIEGSVSGATIDFSSASISKIRVPTLFSSISCRPKSQSLNADNNIRNYLSKLLENENVHFLFRNDGSEQNVAKLGIKSKRIDTILDHGFFIQRSDCIDTLILDERYACLNVVQDQQNFYKSSEVYKGNGYRDFILSLCEKLVMLGYEKIVFVPHITSDLNIISEIVSCLPYDFVNSYVYVAPLGQGEENARKIYGLYKGSSLNIGTRFHTNVCSLAMNVPTLPISITDRLNAMYKSIGLTYRVEQLASQFEDLHERIFEVGMLETAKIINEKQVYTIEKYKEIFSND